MPNVEPFKAYGVERGHARLRHQIAFWKSVERANPVATLQRPVKEVHNLLYRRTSLHAPLHATFATRPRKTKPTMSSRRSGTVLIGYGKKSKSYQETTIPSLDFI